MKFVATVTVATIALLAALRPEVEAHGYLSVPPAQYKNISAMTDFDAVITANVNPVFQSKKWNGKPAVNAKTFAAAFNSSNYTSLRQLLDGTVPGCQNSRTDIPPVNVTELKTMEWRNDEKKMGFVDSHHGPFEVWIDDTRVFYAEDAAATYTAYPAVLPINYAVCAKTNCTLTAYWLAVHEPEWQIYKQCVPITFPESLSIREVRREGSSGANGSTNASAVVTAQPGNGSAATTPEPSKSAAATPLFSSAFSLVLAGSYLAYYFSFD